MRLVLLCCLIVSGGLLLYLQNPAHSGLFPPCPLRALTGLYCPGCGSLRGLHQLLHGNLARAAGLNLLMVGSLPFMMYGFFSYGRSVLSGRPLPSLFIRPAYIWMLLALVIAFGIARNIAVFPLCLLAP